MGAEVVDPLALTRLPATEVQDITPDLDRAILRGSAWVAFSWGGRNALQIVGVVILAHLLDPRAFGLAAIAITITTVLDYIQESGVGAALVQRRTDIKQAAASALVWTSCTGLLLSALCFAAAPWLARAFGTSDATGVIRAMSFVLLIRGVSIGPGSLLDRDMNFRTRTVGELSSGCAWLGISVGLAASGFGVWALVIAQIAATAAQSAILWILAPWRPHPRDARFSVLRELLRYGRFVSLGNILVLINRTLDNFVVGRVLGATSLGVYSLAYRLGDFPTAFVGYAVGRVMFPAYSRLQNDLEAFRRAFIQNLERVALLALPTSVALFATAPLLVSVLLGPKWEAAVTPLRILAIYTVMRSLVSPTGAVFQGLGKPELVPIWALPQAVTFPIALVVLVPTFGINGAAWAVVSSFAFSALPAFRACMRLLDLRLAVVAKRLLPLIGSSIVMALAMSLMLRVKVQPVVDLADSLAVGVVFCLAATLVFARPVLRGIWAGFRLGS